MREKLTPHVEDYLKTIYELTSANTLASTKEIAECLHIAPASVTGMMQKLAETAPPLVYYHKHQGVRLTPAGEKAALEVLRHHRLLESYLHQKLGFAWDEVHEEADRLEHVISEAFAERIAQELGNPLHDPHGDPIPTRDLRMPPTALQPLADLRQNQRAIVVRVRSAQPDLLRHLASLGLVPQAHVTILAYSPFDSNLSLEIGGQSVPVILGEAITRLVFVQVV